MNIDRRWIMLLAVTISAAVGATFASRLRGQRLKVAGETQRKSDLKSWENEGGNLAPPAVPTVQLAANS